uniref:RING-type E3 ubiquitin transferase n=2 Tax=Aegilops tauschii subsp. strangulata TaxID=200361 RepID=A0A453PQY2_AEGTS
MMPVYGGEVRQRTCRMYWCYQCARALRIISYPATDVFCPRCYGRFLHEIDPPPRPALPPPGYFPHHFAPHPHAYYHDGNPRRWVVYGAAPTVPGRPFRQLPPPVREPAPGPTRVHAPAPTPPPRRRMPSPPPAPVARRPSTPPAIDPGDYFTGGDLNRLVEELTQNDRPGPAPAPSSAIDSLPTVRIAAQHLSDDGGSQCPVCKEEFELGEAARQLPCKHVYHSDCIVPWLRLHNSCPVCRFKLPGTGAASSTRRASGSNGARNRDREREREPATTVRWGPLSWMVPARGTEEPDDGWEYGRRAHGRGHGRPEDGDAGGNDLSALQSFVLVATCVFFFSFFA